MSYEKGNKRLGTAAIDTMKDWEAEEDLRCYARAQAIMKDPERMKRMQAFAKKKLDENLKRQEEVDTLVDLGQGKKNDKESKD